MKNLIENILSKLRPEHKKLQVRTQPQEGDWITISFYINYQQRCDLIDSIETKAELPIEFLECFAEQIRLNRLTKESWLAEEKKYWNEVYKRNEY